MHDSILEIMLQKYDEFTKSEKKIIDYVLAHKKSAQYVNISELSAACDVAVSTVSVFCKKLELDGFNDFKLELAKATMPVTGMTAVGTTSGDISANDTLEDVLSKTCNVSQEALLQTYHLLDRDSVRLAVDYLKRAKQVVCLGQGTHSIVATAAWARFSTISSRFKTIQDVHLQTVAVSTLSENDVVLFFSYSGATRELLDIAKVVKSRKAKLILVTRFSHSPGAALADAMLLCGSDEKPLLFGSVAAVVAQLYIVDVLFSEYLRRDYKSGEKTREFVAKALTYRFG
ncbi:MAG: MurR/RpiR family transcriptional regulator [Ruthenibacterium sp.]